MQGSGVSTRGAMYKLSSLFKDGLTIHCSSSEIVYCTDNWNEQVILQGEVGHDRLVSYGI